MLRIDGGAPAGGGSDRDGGGGQALSSSALVDSLNVSVATGILLHSLLASARRAV